MATPIEQIILDFIKGIKEETGHPPTAIVLTDESFAQAYYELVKEMPDENPKDLMLRSSIGYVLVTRESIGCHLAN